ncbi:Dihydroanticapsin 7-dehydrogenase [Pseudoalteromonas holothuriae]|uniref:Dihydroanticapsin 7-dehydrogenase n=2 Tax=Pseudoalteromonas holothuriae TaxID=2963714 RepID=A0ABM9GIA7_9GAMM|nr:Dihydroanticapsin 7-dehydrogenase [Pseudoalteromonas sp. CIP111951]
MYMERNRFEGKNVLVVGGNSGIGLAAAHAFSAERANVIICGRNEETLRSSAMAIGNGTLAYQCDVSDVEQIKNLAETIKSDCGYIDVLFFSSGRCSFCSIDKVTEEDWHWVMDTNLKGMFFTIQAMLPLMPNPSSIVLAGSIAGRLPGASAPVYAASKAGIRSFARSLAADFIDRGIRVNVVSPGPTDTPAYKHARRHNNEDPVAIMERETQDIPMKRLARPEEVANAVLFLASSDSSFTTGTEFLVDGGEVYC